jgi:hypothetical protein
MTSRKEQDKEEGILERMLQSLKVIGQNVERLLYRYGFYNSRAGRKNHDEWSPEDLYENGEY